MKLRHVIEKSHQTLSALGIEHALIGGFALAAHKVIRATQDVDLMIHEDHRNKAKQALIKAGFTLTSETEEVLHLGGVGFLDILIARRPLSQKMLSRAKPDPVLGLPVLCVEDLIGLKIQAYCNNSKREFQDKADIQQLIEKNSPLDWKLIKTYADLFDQWSFIESMKKALTK